MSVNITIDEVNAARTLRQAMRKHPHKTAEFFKLVFQPVQMDQEMALLFAQYCKGVHIQVGFMKQLVELTSQYAKEQKGG